MKILYYNWAPFYQKNNPGGGVNVYQNNLLDYFEQQDDCEIVFLSSGTSYSFFDKKTHIKEVKQTIRPRVKSFELINSPIVAPASGMNELEEYLNDEITYSELKTFIQRTGPYDVIHFNNIEGLGLKCLTIKNDFPDTKVIFSLHNYFMFCPNGYLFRNDKENCVGMDMKCNLCMNRVASQGTFVLFYKIDDLCKKIGVEGLSANIKSNGKTIYSLLKKQNGKQILNQVTHNNQFERFRRKNVEYLNKYVDQVLAVSDRVRDLAILYGVNEKKVLTNYIGTKFSNKNSIANKEYDQTTWITIAYMGFLKKEKGIEFLCDALEKIDEGYAHKITFKCYAKNKGTEYEKELILRIQRLNGKLKKSEYYNGYTHNEIPTIMNSIDVGIIPVIWEDNLPQVAIEFAAHGVAVLASNLGGAHELSSSEHFVYDARSIENFQVALCSIIEHPEYISDYFEKMNPLTSMEEHIEMLLEQYKKLGN